MDVTITHHGGHTGVTGSCHQLTLPTGEALLVDCGLFQGAESEQNINELGEADPTAITFPLDNIHALLITHCHIDHVGRIPYLLMKGWDKPIYATEASAKLLPLVIEDAVRLGITRDTKLIEAVLKKLQRLIRPIPYKKWFAIEGMPKTKCKFKQAGHILGSAYIECDAAGTRAVFSGDLGAPYSPLLPAPKSPWKADILVLESTYGDKRHQGRKERTRRLQQVIEKCLENQGTILIPAFSIGRTQELLYELEEILYQQNRKTKSLSRSLLTPTEQSSESDSRSVLAPTEQSSESNRRSVLAPTEQSSESNRRSVLAPTKQSSESDRRSVLAPTEQNTVRPEPVEGSQQSSVRSESNRRSVLAPTKQNTVRPEPVEGSLQSPVRPKPSPWHNIDIILDSPLAAKFTEHYKELSHCWDKEAKWKLKRGRHPLAFENLTTIESYEQHQWLVNYLGSTGKPAIVIAASGMCAGGRITQYLKKLLPDNKSDVLFVGYQAEGTPGAQIQKYGPKGGYVYLDGERIDIRAGVHTISGYSAHADQKDLVNFVKRMWKKPKEIRLVHGDVSARETLEELFL